MKRNKITSLVLAFMFAVSLSPKAVAMEKEESLIPNPGPILIVPTVIMTIIVSFAGGPARNAMSRASQYFSNLMRRLWNEPEFRHYGLFTDRRILQSMDTCYIYHPPVVSGENIYLLDPLSGLAALSVMQLSPEAIPNGVDDVSLPSLQYSKFSVADSLIFITEQNLNSHGGSLRIIQRDGNNHHALTQTIDFDPARGQHLCSLSRGEYLYVAYRANGVPNNLLNIYGRDERNQYVPAETIDVDFEWIQEIIRLDDNDILLAGQFGPLLVVRQAEDKQHSIVQRIKLPVSNLCHAPVLDGRFIYVSYEKGSDDKPADFHVILRGQDGVCRTWQEFQIGEPTSPVIMGNHVVVASHLSGRVFVFQRDDQGHHHLIQVIGLKDAKPKYLVAHNNALYVSNEYSDLIFIVYRQLDGYFQHIGEFQNPGRSYSQHYSCRPVLHGDVLLLAGGFKFVTLTYPKPRDG